MHPCSKGKSVLGNFVSACVYFSFPDCQVSHSCMLSMKHRTMSSRNWPFKPSISYSSIQVEVKTTAAFPAPQVWPNGFRNL